ncbi:MAG: ATP-binding protein [Cyclobacteriaceae bacterium]|nr:ATP-binding protein [Cyclobacteriaceae bacterium]
MRTWLVGGCYLLGGWLAWGQPPPHAQTWPQALASKKAAITVFWFESKPFVYRADDGSLSGIEYELMEGLRTFVNERYGVALSIDWREADSFGDTFAHIQNDSLDGCFGASAFSLTPVRQRQVAFSPPYMPDLSVLISSADIPIVETAEEFNRVFARLRAITIPGTTYESDLQRLQREGPCPFSIHYISSRENIVDHVEKTPNSFGFIDLPVYMMRFSKNSALRAKRQNVFPTQREGYGIIMPLNTTWQEPVNAYFSQPGFKSSLRAIMGHHLDVDVYDFVEKLANESSEGIALLTKEKEIQYRELLERQADLAGEVRRRNVLLVLVVSFFVSLVVIVVLYRKQNQQKIQIEEQRKNIETKNEQLQKRNEQLMTLDEEKNNLIKILAHDLRAPIHHVQGLTQLLQMTALTDRETKDITQKIQEAATRLNKMITNILDIDALERDRAEFSLEAVSLQEVLEKTRQEFEEPARQKSICLTTEVPATLPLVQGHGVYLMQVVENLVSNAIKFTPSGKNVWVRAWEGPTHVSVAVADEGPGLAPEEIPLLFKKFQRLSARPTAGEPSTGLGLFIVKEYTERMGGKITVQSAPGTGTVFTLAVSRAALPRANEKSGT